MALPTQKNLEWEGWREFGENKTKQKSASVMVMIFKLNHTK